MITVSDTMLFQEDKWRAGKSKRSWRSEDNTGSRDSHLRLLFYIPDLSVTHAEESAMQNLDCLATLDADLKRIEILTEQGTVKVKWLTC